MEKAIKKMNRGISTREAAKAVVVPREYVITLFGYRTWVTKEEYEMHEQKFEEARRKEKTMAMSKDRVRFSIPYHRLINNGDTKALALLGVLQETMGVARHTIRHGVPAAENCHGEAWCDRVYFICRPSQFARFLIARNEVGLCNFFKELQPELFIPEDEKPVPIDCSRNRA